MAFQEIEPEESSGGFRSETFTGVISDICFQEKMRNENFYDFVSMVFEEGPDLDFFEPSDWGELKDFSGIGRIVSDLRKIGIKWLVDTDEKLIKTVPDIKGLEVEMILDKQHKTVNGEEKTYYNWNLKVVDPKQIGKTSGSSKKKEKENKADDEILARCETEITTILESLGGSGLEKDIIKGITANYPEITDRKPIQAVRKQVLAKMVEEGTLEDNVGTYTLV